MENENNEEKKVDVTPTSDEGKTSETSQNRTEKDKAIFTIKKQAERLKELGVDPTEIIGQKPAEKVNQNDVPEWYLKEKAKEQTQTALQMADKISDEDTREKVKTYLQTRIVPSGNPEQDYKDALGAVSASKNTKIIEEITRVIQPKVVATGGSANASVEEEFVPTPQEEIFMKPPYNISKEKIIEARKKAQQ